MTFTPGHVDFICYNEDNATFPEATVMGWGATQVQSWKETNDKVFGILHKDGIASSLERRIAFDWFTESQRHYIDRVRCLR